MKNIFIIALILTVTSTLNATEYHVSKKGNDNNPGSYLKPFETISKAANIAVAGDTITVHEGTYRERVNPINSGKSNRQRILYRAAENERVVIKGSEEIKGWKNIGRGIWKTTIDNALFKDYNPYQDSLYGDWFWDQGRIHHTGEVFLNEKSMYEVTSMEQLEKTASFAKSTDQEGSKYQWYCESDKSETTIWANFQEKDPNQELTEVTFRQTCFYPENPGINFITVRGFEMSQAATPFAAPTAEQIGIIGTHWSKGWIIEDNVVSNAKCVGITLGKDRLTGQNTWSKQSIKNGSTSYNEVILKAVYTGWSKETIGSHIVRNNTVFACEEAGICGSLGAIFSEISGNHVYDIFVKRIFRGGEMGGIKIHGAIDTKIEKNHVHNTLNGIFIDWMAQGTSVSSNLIYDNDGTDIFSEANHGPYVVDNNILLSDLAVRDWSEGGAYVHNLISGKIHFKHVTSRYVPYLLPHSTQLAGFVNCLDSDNRYINNIFIKGSAPLNKGKKNGEVFGYGISSYDNTKIPIIAKSNVYYNGVEAGKTDTNFLYHPNFNPQAKLEQTADGYFLTIHFNDAILKMKNPLVTTELLGQTLISEAFFENPDGSMLLIDTDYLGNTRNKINPTPGPLEKISSRPLKVKVWDK